MLVRPQSAGNIGAAARAMKNMGMSDLVLVRPAARRGRAAQVMAVHAEDVLDRARTVADIAAAVADCGLVVGTTCRGGRYRKAASDLDVAAPELVAAARRGPVALLFGPEDHGLSNDDLKHCQQLVTIGTNPAYASLNLAQAVLLTCDAIRRAATARGEPALAFDPAPARDVAFAFERLQAALLRIGFLHEQNPDHIMFAFRRILGRAGLEARDVRILLGLARQIEWYARDGWRREACVGAAAPVRRSRRGRLRAGG